jgi:hypothetical protein
LIDKRAVRDLYEHYSRAAFPCCFFDMAMTVIWSSAWIRNLRRCDATSGGSRQCHSRQN